MAFSGTALLTLLLHFLEIDHSDREVQAVGLGHLDTGIGGSNPAQSVDISPGISVLCRSVEVEALRRADAASSESYQM
jgi:hypothetical protein